MHVEFREPVPPMRRRLKPLALLGAATLLLHAAALGGLQWTWPQRSELVLPVAAMQVRVVAAPAPRPADDAVAITKQQHLPMTRATRDRSDQIANHAAQQ